MGSLACVVLENWVELRIGSVTARSGWTHHEEAPRFSTDGGKLDEIHAWHGITCYCTVQYKVLGIDNRLIDEARP